ncbi:glycoside hydrolase family 3 C-terminal domain-containing protein [Nonomuraea sp. NBC_01738]|uniref:beta-glucosidase H n=1 Tax=Nonomuraea sp. NBC_01738 TaxID=2976003 RepID=UPI002E0F001A|nr:glycoside hydrolase family 3 C-terminal domain-containing protein [Nonomuraea sp. NBC_01738]
MDYDDLINKLDLTTKIRLLTGADMWSLPPIPEIGLDRLVMSDGPIGVRGEQWSAVDPSIALPSPTALAATWDIGLVKQVGRLLAQEARRKGVHVLLAPTINLHRTPLGGRHFECFSEDPFLTGEIGAAYVEGVQEGGVATTPKHFVANDFETDRFTVNIKVTDKVLREVYLAPFERVVGAGAWGLMSAYNSVNGTTMTEHSDLVNGVLKDEWGFDGYVVSDWTAVRSTEAAAMGGTDVAMPGPNGPWGAKLEEAVREGRVPESVIDDRVRRILRLAERTGALRGSASRTAEGADVDGIALAREVAARSFTLLKNDGDVLPLRDVRSLALIGSAADEARIMGGGSAQVFPDRIVSPLDGLRERGDVEVRYALGTDPRVRLAPLTLPTTATFLSADDDVLATEHLATTEARWIGQLPEMERDRLTFVELRAEYTPEIGGEHAFSVAGVGAFTVSVGGRTVIDETILLKSEDAAGAFLAPPERRVSVELAAGETVEIKVRHVTGSLKGFGLVAFTLGHADPMPGEDELIAEAVRVAAGSDVAVVVASTTLEVESEGFDRTDLKLPGRQDELISAVAAANPRTIVVVNAGSPVEMPWAGEVAAILLTWFPGQEAGGALADVLHGDAEPGGRLPTTWPVSLDDSPVVDVTPVEGAVPYEEGVFIGYRAWEREGRAPAYWFGHGLGYTTWNYNAIDANAESVTVSVTNTGTRPGREVVQVYLAPVARDGRPARALAGFDVVEAGPGETVVTTILLAARAFQEWDGNGWRTADGEYAVQAGRSVADLPLSTKIKI